MNDILDKQTRTMRWVLFWLFIGLFSLIVIATLAMVFLGFGSPTEEERRLLVKLFIGEVGVSVVALFWSIFKLRRPAAMQHAVPSGASEERLAASLGNNQALPSANYAEIDFLRAFLTIFTPDTSPGDPCSHIIEGHFKRIQSELRRLEEEENWENLILLRERLREYFEYSGRYSDGIVFGNAYVRALRHVGKPLDAVWAKIKGVGYMLVLAGEHQAAREVLNDALADMKDLESNGLTNLHGCYFYCLRYLGISYHRDQDFGDIHKANELFLEAEKHVQALSPKPLEYKSVRARLLGNFGNVALSKKRYRESLAYYRQAHDIFREIGDVEHTGIAQMQIAQAIIASGEELGESFDRLQDARLKFISLGWIEGQARVAEQLAKYFERLANTDPSKPTKKYIQFALQAANESKKLFERVGIERQIGRMEEIIDRLKRAEPNQ